MNILSELRRRFAAALAAVAEGRLASAELDDLTEMVRPSQDPKFGDYQANCAMPLGKRLGQSPREVAAQIVARLTLDDLCEAAEVAGPGFINLRLRSDWLKKQLTAAAADPRLGIGPAEKPRTFVVDYSAPNVAKPMHVGHIRSTVIGDALYRVLKFLGHRAIGDNHIGDWGTQFGMIIYGYKNFLDPAAYKQSPVDELARLYRLVNKLAAYGGEKASIDTLNGAIAKLEPDLKRLSGSTDAKSKEQLKNTEKRLQAQRQQLRDVQASVAEVENDPVLSQLVKQHPTIDADVLAETAKLHAGDPENRRLWQEFLPPCLADIERIYQRLGVSFDFTLGEGFYHDRLAAVVADLLKNGIAKQSEGAVAVFLSENPDDPPLLIQKKDGAFLYGTTDLATIQFRMETWHPDAILYVVDHRQSLHFKQLFETARRWGYTGVELQHVSFGTVLGEDGRPFKTRSGGTIGLDGLLDEAVSRALAIVTANDDGKPTGPELSPDERRRVAEAVGIGALKYADLSQNRTSDYVFSYEKMLAMNGNTATYMQYAHARVRSIFARGQSQMAKSAPATAADIMLDSHAERALGLEILRLAESLEAVTADYRPNHLTNYLFELANRYSTFYEACPVLKAETAELQRSRLALCDLTARTLRQGLALLGIDVVEKM